MMNWTIVRIAEPGEGQGRRRIAAGLPDLPGF